MEARPTLEAFEIAQKGRTAIVQIARPERKNSLTQAMWVELGDIFERLSRQADVLHIVLSGKGGVFSAGADISEFASARGNASAAAAYEAQVDRCLQRIVEAPKPTTAAISGACLGGGFALAQACDFRFADQTAYFGVSAAKMGLVYGIPKCRRLVQLVGLTQAKSILLTGKRFDYAEMKSIGFVDEVAGNALDRALEFAVELELMAPLAVSGMKAVLDAVATGVTTERQAELELLVQRAADSEDHKEAVDAFIAKRPPRFRGQ